MDLWKKSNILAGETQSAVSHQEEAQKRVNTHPPCWLDHSAGEFEVSERRNDVNCLQRSISMQNCGFLCHIVDFHQQLWISMQYCDILWEIKRNEKCLYTRIGESCLSILLLMHRNKFDYFSAIAKLFSRNRETFKSTFYSLLLWKIWWWIFFPKVLTTNKS